VASSGSSINLGLFEQRIIIAPSGGLEKKERKERKRIPTSGNYLIFALSPAPLLFQCNGQKKRGGKGRGRAAVLRRGLTATVLLRRTYGTKGERKKRKHAMLLRRFRDIAALHSLHLGEEKRVRNTLEGVPIFVDFRVTERKGKGGAHSSVWESCDEVSVDFSGSSPAGGGRKGRKKGGGEPRQPKGEDLLELP